MKKLLSIVLALVLCLTAAGFSAAALTSPEDAIVFVTIADENGKLAIAQQEVTVTDIDQDGELTINDALYLAHEQFYEGGAAAGYASSVGAYGLGLDKLWGVANGGSYGYYVNNKSAWGLTDAVKEGDYVNAFIYTDTTYWSDAYTYFDQKAVDAKAGEEITVTLYKAGFDATYNQIEVAVKDAVVLVDGKKIDAKTDQNGKVTFTINKAGNYTVSAASDSERLVPAALKVTVTGEVEQVIEETKTETSPKTGDNTDFTLRTSALAVLFMLIAIAVFTGKKVNEK